MDQLFLNVLFLTSGTKTPSSRFRVQQYLKYLPNRQIRYRHSSSVPDRHYYESFLSTFLKVIKRVPDILTSPFFNCVHIQKDLIMELPPVIELTISKINHNMIFDFDDAIFLHAPKKTKHLLRMARLVTAGNSYLAEYAIKYNPNTVIIPTVVDTSIYLPRKHKETNTQVLGWIGTKSNLKYVSEIEEPLNIIYKQNKFKLLIVSDSKASPFSKNEFPIELIKWSDREETEMIHKFDIGIMPLSIGEREKGKCGLKILQYEACGIPSVSTKIGVNNEIIKEGYNGFLATTKNDWVDKLIMLIKDPDMRHKIGSNARMDVEARYSVNTQLDNFVKAISDTSK